MTEQRVYKSAETVFRMSNTPEVDDTVEIIFQNKRCMGKITRINTQKGETTIQLYNPFNREIGYSWDTRVSFPLTIVAKANPMWQDSYEYWLEQGDIIENDDGSWSIRQG